MINAAEQLQSHQPLGTDINPFSSSAGAPRTCGPVKTALGDVIRHIERKCPIVVVTGRPGTGKTLLVDMIARACSDMGLSARQVARADLTDASPGTPVDVLLADEADSIPAAALARLMPTEGDSIATTWVFLCRPVSTPRFNCPAAKFVDLQGLSILDARTYLLEQANSIGRPDLFSPDAMDLIVYRAAGSSRSLRSIASLAFSTAAWEEERQISVSHVTEVLESPMLRMPIEDGAAAQSRVSHNDSASHLDTKHLPEHVLDSPEPIGRDGHVSLGRKTEEHKLKQLAGGRSGRLAGIAAGIAGFIALASAASVLLLNPNNSGAGMNFGSPVGAPVVREQSEAGIGLVPTLAVAPAGTTNQIGAASNTAEPTAATIQPLAVAPASRPDQTSLASDTAEPTAAVTPSLGDVPANPADPAGPAADAAEPTTGANSPPPTARQPTRVSRDLNPRTTARARAALRSGSTATGRVARVAGTTKRGSSPPRATTPRISARQVAAKEAEERAREAEERARQAEEAARQAAEAARQAEDAQREADNAARRADDAVRYATEAVRHAEDAARQADAIARRADRRVRIILRP